MPDEHERIAAGPALLARRFGIDRRQDAQPVETAAGLWIAPRPPVLISLAADALQQTTRIGITQGQELPWRWYLRASRSVSKRARGDRSPAVADALNVAALPIGF
jgi:DNA-3-methyladenine glycosylase